ncbi:unnamed protein product [Caenorhabditis auriculariae]|uniref:Uncharacterized protein n=1 Tax=Caenorhabditis auriculariae TaxID=2777116 RepID=A0A8S1HTP5_9PELO|nr:unnamed protein product [Caenorhabditis auriculariae]
MDDKEVGSVFFAGYGCCIGTQDYVWMLVVLFIVGVTFCVLCLFVTALVQWVYKRRMRKRGAELKTKFADEEKLKRELEIRLKFLAQKSKIQAQQNRPIRTDAPVNPVPPQVTAAKMDNMNLGALPPIVPVKVHASATDFDETPYAASTAGSRDPIKLAKGRNFSPIMSDSLAKKGAKKSSSSLLDDPPTPGATVHLPPDDTWLKLVESLNKQKLTAAQATTSAAPQAQQSSQPGSRNGSIQNSAESHEKATAMMKTATTPGKKTSSPTNTGRPTNRSKTRSSSLSPIRTTNKPAATQRAKDTKPILPPMHGSNESRKDSHVRPDVKNKKKSEKPLLSPVPELTLSPTTSSLQSAPTVTSQRSLLSEDTNGTTPASPSPKPLSSPERRKLEQAMKSSSERREPAGKSTYNFSDSTRAFSEFYRSPKVPDFKSVTRLGSVETDSPAERRRRYLTSLTSSASSSVAGTRQRAQVTIDSTGTPTSMTTSSTQQNGWSSSATFATTSSSGRSSFPHGAFRFAN